MTMYTDGSEAHKRQEITAMYSTMCTQACIQHYLNDGDHTSSCQ